MKRFISALTSLAMVASIAVGTFASVSAASDNDYTFSFETAFGENTKTITTEEVAAGDVTVPIKLRSYNDPGTVGMTFGMELDAAAKAAGVTMINGKSGISTAIFPIRGQAIYQNDKFAWISSGTAENQVAQVGEEFYLLSFDLVIPQGTAEGTYSVSANAESLDVVSTEDDAQGKPVSSQLFPALKAATIVVGEGSVTEPTETTVTDPVVEGKTVDYEIETVNLTKAELAALDTDGDGIAEVPVKMTINNDPGTAGIHLHFVNEDDTISFKDIEVGNAYPDEAWNDVLTYNVKPNDVYFLWGGLNDADDTVVDMFAADGSALMTLTMSVPVDAAAKEYPINFASVSEKRFIDVIDSNSKDITVNMTNGAIVIEGDPDVEKEVDYEIETVNLKRAQLEALDTDGDGIAEVPVKMTINNDPGTAGIHLHFVNEDDTISFKDIEVGNAYPDEAWNDVLTYNVKPNDVYFLWGGLNDADDTVVDMFAADGSTLLTFTMEVPVDAAAKEYPINFASVSEKRFIDVIDSNSKDITVNMTNGAIVIEPEEETPTDTEPTDTEPTDTEPTDTEPTDTEPTDTEPTDTEPTDTEPTDTEAPVETTIVISVETTIVISEVEVPGETTIVISEVEVPGETTIVISEVEVPGETTIVISEVEVPGETTIVISEVELPVETTIVISEVEVPGETSIVYVTVTEETTTTDVEDVEYAVAGRLFYWADEAAFDFNVTADGEAFDGYTLDAATPGDAFDGADTYTINVLVDGEVVATIDVQIALRGDTDLNNSVEALDASLALEAAVASALGKDTGLTDFQLFVANVDQNITAGNVEFEVETLDASYILEFSTKNALKPGSADWNKIID